MKFGNETVGLQSSVLSTVVTDTSSTSPLTIDSMSITGAGFYLSAGTAPYSLPPGGTFQYGVYFEPSAPGPYSGQFTLVINGQTVVIPLTGTGVATSAAVSLSTSALFFGANPVGIATANQPFTITNTGTSTLTVRGITVNAPFTLHGFTKAVALGPGQSITPSVSFFGSTVGTWSQSVVITYDVLPVNGFTVQGTAVNHTSFRITSFPALPTGTIGYAYLATLESAGGIGNVTWSLVPGPGTAVLPAGLTLSSAGVISGAIASSVTVGTLSPVIEAVDSATPPHTVKLHMTIASKLPTGSACNNISWNVAGTTQPLLDIPDLASGTYLGEQGGLYPNGKNLRPASHDSDGVALGNSIQPLDSNGNPSPTGKYVFMSLGISTGQDAWSEFSQMARVDSEINPNLVLVNGAEPNGTADAFANPASSFWTTITEFLLPQSGVTANQVVAVWYQDLSISPTGTFPSDMAGLKTDIESTAQNLHKFFPNLKLLYLSPWPYAGYCNGIQTYILEPFGYENGFAVKNAIGDQLSGLLSLNYNPNDGPVNAPWMDWGPYLWSNGMLADSNGFATTCQDLMSDCRHPSPVLGQDKWASMMLDYFKLEDTAQPWFLSLEAFAARQK